MIKLYPEVWNTKNSNQYFPGLTTHIQSFCEIFLSTLIGIVYCMYHVVLASATQAISKLVSRNFVIFIQVNLYSIIIPI